MYLAGNAPIISADITLPYQGVWVADIETTSEATFKVGDTIKMSVGSMRMVGTVIRGSNNADSARFMVVGGKGGWRKMVARRFYQDANGIKLSQVLRDLAKEAGESIEVDASISGVFVGDAWTRAASLASDCIQKLGKVWRVRPDGVTVVAPSTVTKATKRFSIRSFNAATGIVIVDFPEDGMEELIPGYSVKSGEFSFTIRSTRIMVADGSVYARVST